MVNQREEPDSKFMRYVVIDQARLSGLPVLLGTLCVCAQALSQLTTQRSFAPQACPSSSCLPVWRGVWGAARWCAGPCAWKQALHALHAQLVSKLVTLPLETDLIHLRVMDAQRLL